MRLTAAIIGVVLMGGGGAQASPETLRFAITRNGEQIGTHTIEINRSGKETTVTLSTDLTVKILFVTAYRLQHTETERWIDGKLVALNSTSDDNGTRHTVSAAAKGSGLEVKVDGKATLVDPNIMPASLWNPELLKRPVMLDTKDGQIMPVSVRDGGEEDVKVDARTVRARRYTVNSRYSQDVWFDDQARPVQAKLIASDGSVIMYRPI